MVSEQKFEIREIKINSINFDDDWKFSGKTVNLQLLFDKEVEYYFNTPGEVPDSELLTKIVFPVK
jgi:hypothetical protein